RARYILNLRTRSPIRAIRAVPNMAAPTRVRSPGAETAARWSDRPAEPLADSCLPGSGGSAPTQALPLQSRLLVAFGQPGFRFSPPGIQPGAYFLPSQMPARFLVCLPGSHRLLLEGLACFFASDVLRDGFSHDPVWRSLSLCRKLLHAP